MDNASLTLTSSTFDPIDVTTTHTDSATFMQDPETFEQCFVDEMLKDLLMDCADKSREWFDGTRKTCLFEECLKKVLPICNGVAQARNKTIKGKSYEIKDNIAEYSRKHFEMKQRSYPLFVKAANIALLFLQELQIEHVRPATNHDVPAVRFHVNDPALLKQSYQGQVSQCNPDVVIVSESDGLKMECPTKQFEWRSVRTFVDFLTPKNKLEDPPTSYTLQQYTPPQEHAYLSLSHEPDQDALLVARSVSSGADPRLLPPGLKPGNQWSHKRTSNHLGDHPNRSQSKRKKSEHRNGHPDITGTGYYHAAEMFAGHAARLHAFGLLIVGDVLYLWRYDRQGIIQCSGFNFILDLPRFLVLLLVMQRFENQHWGLNPHIDPDFGHRPGYHVASFRSTNDPGEDDISITLDLSDQRHITHFGLNGRATNLFPATSRSLSDKEDDLVVEVFWPEVVRMSEPDILRRVYDIAERNDDVKGHVPEFLWHKVFEDASTVRIRERLGLKTQGARVLHMIVFRRLRPITELVGDKFLHAWWETVKCHLALWRNGVHHRDISPSNLMYHEDAEGKVVGVLNDFDLASTGGSVPATEHTGTIPFMAMALLEDRALRGEIPHSYEHDVESFIWVLMWIALRYDKGNLRGSDRNRPFDQWLKADAAGCRKEKLGLLGSKIRELTFRAGEGHARNWEVAKKCIIALKNTVFIETSEDSDPLQSLDEAFKILLKDPVCSYLQNF